MCSNAKQVYAIKMGYDVLPPLVLHQSGLRHNPSEHNAIVTRKQLPYARDPNL